MRQQSKRILVAMIMLITAGQTLAGPLNTSMTARSNQQGHWGLDTGIIGTHHLYGAVSPYVRGGYGLTENLDVGVEAEAYTFLLVPLAIAAGPWAKYSLLSQDTGLSVALEAGMGGAAVTFAPDEVAVAYAYAGPVASYKFKYAEPYISVQAVGVTGYVDYSAVKTSVGNTFWINDKVGLGINAQAVDREFATVGLNVSVKF